ncbi:Tungsten-containing aldehyde ferredoxin oxidoreductase (fragment) [uncultured Desulfobacterium sp.]|uniref:Tungsten-containing aldehyde ferredoxin oxidoreductase n=1 Tax=uncultured Desulfobacterium sp. TaxID=201089 RepID=A0A445MT55_9BACT
MGDWTQRVLRIDLSNRRYQKENLDVNTLKMFLGGQGVATKILMDEVDPKVVPLSPENKMIFSTGPLTGTEAPLGSRYMVSTKSPLTGLLGFGNSGGFFGPTMRKAGYDHIIFEGKSDTPVYLVITDKDIEFRNAGHLWGKDTHETEAIIKKGGIAHLCG